ncbi:hypothetical protein WJ438_36925 [Streptomyces sp. GD-15H]|uniref:hypothetical protein n=1 Tax=Streptomyces sp. GD-15H TaxID=3129112 RepID=UPI00324945AF
MRIPHAGSSYNGEDRYKFCSDPGELQAYEVAVIREKLTGIHRFIAGVVVPHAALQPKDRWIKHLNTRSARSSSHSR